MKYMLLITTDPALDTYGTATDGEAMSKDYFAFTQRILQSGELVGGDRLHDSASATTVRVRSGSTAITDGPFAETKEQIAGYYIVDVSSLDRALELAAEIPGATQGAIEVRPIVDMVAG